TAVIATQTAYDCCERGHFFRTILEYQLADLSLVQWPPQAIDTIEMLNSWGGNDYFSASWTTNDTVRNRNSVYSQRFYPMVELLAQEIDDNSSLIEMQRSLAAHDTIVSWLTEFMGEVDLVTFETDLQRHVLRDGSTSLTTPPPYPYPNQQLQLQCRAENSGGIYLYDPTSEKWITQFSPDLADNSSGFLIPISGHPELYVAQEIGSPGVNANLRKITVYENGEPIAVIDETLEAFDNMWINDADPTGQFLVLSHYSSTSPVSAFELVDLRNCDGLKCERVSLAGWPLWSPDGRFTFITSIMQANLSAIN
ncbi:MAG: hypothetical protein GY943_05280, partial [Chloroflexi bacterium]|nr:hypothetical protein [Chloroflexota bacterium]